MKKFFKNNTILLLTLLFVVLIFKHNLLFQKTIIEACTIFFENVFTTLFPMLIINDILLKFNFMTILNLFLAPLFKKIFKMTKAATYIFLMSILSGTPTNGFIAKELVKKKYLSPKDASQILAYSFFLNPLFLYGMINNIFHNSHITWKLILITYLTNILFLLRTPKQKEVQFIPTTSEQNFDQVIKKSITHAFDVLINILGTIIFYFVLSKGISLFIKNPLLNCIISGTLEVTSGLAKIKTLQISFLAKEILTLAFISFGGLSIHTQIKNIIKEEHISFRPFFWSRIFHVLIATFCCIILS